MKSFMLRVELHWFATVNTDNDIRFCLKKFYNLIRPFNELFRFENIKYEHKLFSAIKSFMLRVELHWFATVTTDNDIWFCLMTFIIWLNRLYSHIDSY